HSIACLVPVSARRTLSITLLPPPPRSTLFPYTTLFRSDPTGQPGCARVDNASVQRRRLHRQRGADMDGRRWRHHHVCLHTGRQEDRKSTRLNSSHGSISYAVFCLKKKI